MSTPPTQLHDVPRPSVVRRLPRLIDRPIANVEQFVRRELQHWGNDLKERRQEGLLYLEWFDWLDYNQTDTLACFQDLVNKELSELIDVIEQFLLEDSEEELDLEYLLQLQNEYARFCSEYDRIRLIIIEEMDPMGSIQIY